MENLAPDVIVILQYLLPGFIAAGIFHSLTSHPKQSQFERVVQALIFTFIIQILVLATKKFNPLWILYFTNSSLLISFIISIIFGLLLSFFANNDCLNKTLRKLRVTQETSFASEWFSAFSGNTACVILNLKDGRRIYGFPEEWPSNANSGHILLKSESWLGERNEEIDLKNLETVLIDVCNVEFVEFMKIKKRRA